MNSGHIPPFNPRLLTDMTSILIRPSTMLIEGICIQKSNNITLLKFTEKMGDRMQELLDKKKSNTLDPKELMELETIGELDNICSYVNSVMAAQINITS